MKCTDGFAIFDKLLQKEPCKKIGPYEIQDLIGQGGMSQVYRAYDSNLDRIIALKVISIRDRKLQSFLKKEAKAVARLQHPNIVKIFDFSQDENYFYIAMEYVAGETLKEYLAKNKVSFDWFLQISIQLADAIYHAHQEGVIHRDLKPENIMLQNNHIKVMDFGLAKLVDSTSISKEEAWGTLAYMAPEQVMEKSSRIDQRTDIYALGIIMYEMLSGKSPFSDVLQSNATRIVEEVPLSPKKINQQIPKKITQICLKCIAKKPRDRYASAKILKKELESASQNINRFSIQKLTFSAFFMIIAILAVLSWSLFQKNNMLTNKMSNLVLQLQNKNQQIEANLTSNAIKILHDLFLNDYTTINYQHKLKVIENSLDEKEQYKLLELYGKILFDNYFHASTIKNNSELLNKALAYFEKAIELNPKSEVSHFYCHLIYYLHASPTANNQNLSLLYKMREFSNDFSMYSNAFLIFYLHNKSAPFDEIEEALNLANKIIDHQPQMVYFHWLKILILRSLNKEKEFFEYCNYVLKIFPLHPFILYQRIAYNYKVNNFIAAFEDTQTMIENGIYIKGLWFIRGRILKQLSRYQEAIDSFQKALDHQYPAELCYENRQSTYFLLEDYKNSIADCNSLIAISSNNKEYYSKRAETFVAMKQYKNAVDDYEKAYSLDNNDKKIVLQLANVYNILQEYDLAKKMLKKLQK